MCGIAGVWHTDRDKHVDRTALRRMSSVLRHRGPDDDGLFTGGSIGLAHQRLSIIDLSSAGRQPMSTPDGWYTLVYNGEIYNYQQLSERYCRDINLRSSSDTEVLLQVLAKKGAAALSELRGMFALALWDARGKRLLLATGPFGKKPLYYRWQNGTFLFASEVKALLEYPGVEAKLDREAVAKYFLYEYVPAPATGYKDIKRLPMGSLAEITTSGCNVRQWWQPSFTPKDSCQSERQALSSFDEKMGAAVRRRMVADVPVGVLLSGGIDSTAIAWYMRRQQPRELHSFSVSFREKEFNEGGFARRAAEAVGTRHHGLRFDMDQFHKSLDKIASLMDVPFGDASLLPTYAVSQLARRQVKVVLDGDGGDELLGGYGTFQAARAARFIPGLPRGFWRAAYKAAWRLPTNYGYFSFDFKLKSFLKGLGYGLPYRNQIWLGSFSDVELRDLLTDDWRQELNGLFVDIDRLAARNSRLNTTDAVSQLTLLHYLHNDIVVKLDRATMFTGLEARTPFLDVDLAEFVMRLPEKFKRNKYLLKKVMRGRIPDSIIDRGKRGFALPLGYWLKGPLHEWARELLNEQKLRSDGVLRPAAVSRLLQEHRGGRADHRKKLWTLLAWQMWHDRWIHNY